MSSYISCLLVILAATGQAHQVAYIKDRGAVQPQQQEATLLKPIGASSHFANKTDAIRSLDAIYSGHASHAFWKVNDYHGAVQELLNTHGVPKQAILYGEILPTALMQLLNHIDAQPGQQFFDLGSGTGKSVFAAWLLGLNATGVEVVRTRWNTACKVAANSHNVGFKKSEDGPGVSFVHGNFLTTDLSDADIVFINSVMYSPETMQGLAPMARRMKTGAKVISTLGLPGEGFRFDEKVVAPTSWDLGTQWIIQTVLAAPVAVTEGVPKGKSPGAAVKEEGASLIRKEPVAPHGPLVGPVFGAVKLPQAPSNIETGSSNSCNFDGYLEDAVTKSTKPTLTKEAVLKDASKVKF